LGHIAGKKERWTVFDGFYWWFVTVHAPTFALAAHDVAARVP